ncbi:MAG: PD40 domain-containing protein [Gammaproteobacteria bacterium]|nr:PD40 domain-containing protein [Gammaproteobacteria bacterium]
MKYRNLSLLPTLPLLFISLTHAATTPEPESQSSWRENRLIPLERITVGPWDNFDPTARSDNDTLYFTRSQNQIPRIYLHKISQRQSQPLPGIEGDSKDPALSPNGKQLAYTAYHSDSRGDVCLLDLLQEEKHCLTSNNESDRSPFWIDNQHLGFLSKPPQENNWQLRVMNLHSSAQQTLLSGQISAATASHSGRYIILNQQLDNGQRQTVLYDRHDNSQRPLSPFDLPGVPGFYAFSSDDQQLYFNYHLSDTNHDQLIDGNDHSVAFRIDFAQLLSSDKPLLPEQLTSVSDNCSFPAISGEKLLLTCALDGSLDIYQAPLSGTVPIHWKRETLWDAHRSARSPQERLLLINAMRFRFGDLFNAANTIDLLERLLSLHLQTQELTAANYYIQQLQQRYLNHRDSNRRPLAAFYRQLESYTRLLALKAAEPSGVITNRFERAAATLKSEVEGMREWPQLQQIILATLESSLNQPEAALARLNRLPQISTLLPLEQYLSFERYRELYKDQPKRLLPHYSAMIHSSTLSPESRLYYAFNYLKLLAQSAESAAERHQQLIEQAALETPEHPLTQLFLGELAALELSQATAGQASNDLFRSFATLLKNNSKDPLLRRAMHTRAITILGDANRFELMELLSRNWLTTTHIDELDFIYSAEQYSIITMDKAYGMMQQKDLLRTYNTFYSAIRQTNDLEAYYQFVTLGLTAGLNRAENLKTSLDLLKQQKILTDRGSYVNALQQLHLTAELPATERTTSLQIIKQPLLAEPAPEGLGAALYDLLLGYLSHEQLNISRNGFNYDKTLFEQAHHHYMMALDLGRDNSRISAAAWENLAWLHFEVGNYALAAGYFNHRMAYPFPHANNEVASRLSYARSLFYSNAGKTAAEEAQRALQLAQTTDMPLAAIREKSAFYQMQAGDYGAAAKSYQQLMKESSAELSGANLARILLAYGYCEMRSGNLTEARLLLQQSDAAAAKVDRQTPQQANASGKRLPYYPERQQLIAHGLMANMAKAENDNATALQHRQLHLQLLQSLAGESNRFALKEAQRLSQVTRDLNQIAALHETLQQREEMASAIHAALQSAISWRQESDNPSGPPIYQTLLNYMTLAIEYPQQFASSEFKNDPQQIDHAINELLANLAPLLAASNELQSRSTTLKTLQQRYHQRPS